MTDVNQSAPPASVHHCRALGFQRIQRWFIVICTVRKRVSLYNVMLTLLAALNAKMVKG